jgi:hypothetical protein
MNSFFEQKIINTTTFYDYINLKDTPIYLCIDENKKSKKEILLTNWTYGLSFSFQKKNNYIKVNSLSILADELKKHDFIFDKNWNKRVKFIQAELYK